MLNVPFSLYALEATTGRSAIGSLLYALGSYPTPSGLKFMIICFGGIRVQYSMFNVPCSMFSELSSMLSRPRLTQSTPSGLGID